MSNSSVRNCRLNFSVILVFLTIEKSVFTKSGPCNASRWMLPGVQLPGTTAKKGLPVAGTVATLLNVHGTANAAFGVVAQFGVVRVAPVGTPLKFSQRTGLL